MALLDTVRFLRIAMCVYCFTVQAWILLNNWHNSIIISWWKLCWKVEVICLRSIIPVNNHNYILETNIIVPPICIEKKLNSLKCCLLTMQSLAKLLVHSLSSWYVIKALRCTTLHMRKVSVGKIILWTAILHHRA